MDLTVSISRLISLMMELERMNYMENKNNTSRLPQMMTVRQVAATGILPESAIRNMLREKKLPAVYSGKKAFINFDLMCQQLSNLGCVC